MARPSSRPIRFRDGFYLEVRNKGDRNGIKIHRDTREEIDVAVQRYGKSKEVVYLGEVKDGKFLDN